MSIESSRRAFLAGTGALVVGTFLPQKGRAQAAKAAADFSPNAFIRIAPDNTVTIISKHIEFGQGPWTGLATLVAEELDADWSQIRAESAPANVKLYANSLFGMQLTGGSTAMANSYMQMRNAGAAARAMLVQAAAKKWDVKASSITVSEGVLTSGANSATFGDMASLAAMETAPDTPKLKARKDFKLIGKDQTKLDTVSKSDGSAVFTLDLYPENLITAVVAHSPTFGGVLADFDDGEARKVSGIVDVKAIAQGVAVYGENTYAALKARNTLKSNWNTKGAETRSSAQLKPIFMDALNKPGEDASASGDVKAALGEADNVLEAEYYFPLLAHAPMEPLDGVIEKRGDQFEVWYGAQGATPDRMAIAKVLGTSPANVKLNVMLAGGSFGRRATPGSEFAVELASAFKATDMTRPLKLMWTREDDIKGGFYRPITAHKVRGAIDKSGNITAWDHVIAGQSIMKGTPFDSGAKVDASMVEGAREPYYEMPHHRLGAHIVDAGVPPLWWRSVGHTHTGYVMETFIDELLQSRNIDPVKGRMRLLKDPREKAVLKRVAEIADWGRTAPAGQEFGVAVHKSFGTYVAQIALTSIEKGKPRVHKVWCAVDCGVAVNPNIIRAQIEGGIGYGLGAVLFDEITLGEGGIVEQSNFHDYRSIRINEMPDVEVSIIESDINPTGIGEPGTPPCAPAMANAIRRLSGKAHYTLPIVGLHDPVGA